MAILHPLECYLLERFSSPEHFAATRDAIIAFIDAHEAAYRRYQQDLPARIRKEPLWKQGDVVWGSRVLPNIRPSREQYINA
ncbi:TPA: type VI secretion protein ImpA, partial [Enterobacter cloacae]